LARGERTEQNKIEIDDWEEKCLKEKENSY